MTFARRDILLGSLMPAALGAAREGDLEKAASLLRGSVESGAVRSAVLEIRRGGYRFSRAFGEAKDSDAVFLIASITKPMTAAGLMILADRGELKLTDPVHKFIPEFTGGDRKLVTVHHLLTHSSGLPDMLPENVELRKRQAPLKEFVERSITTPLLFKPGTKVQYQSMGILVAAEIAERITNKAFRLFLQEELFRPLGMNRTALGLGRFRIEDTQRSQAEQAEPTYGGSAGDTQKWDWNSPYWRDLGAPWGGAHSTGPDIARFLESFLHPDGKVLKKETAAAMVVNQHQGLNDVYGIGFSVRPGAFGKGSSPRAFGHGGSTGTLAWADPATGLACAILTTLPARVSNALVLRPVADVVSASART